jgi:hypothetical protein
MGDTRKLLVGLRPSCANEKKPSERTGTGNGGNGRQNSHGDKIFVTV